MDLRLAKEVAINAVTGAGRIVMDNFGKDKRMSFKGRGDIVTDVDFKSEKFIISLIADNFPDHTILSEEAGLIEKKFEYVWVMDPIDGTINYYHGVEPFCVGLCLVKNDELIISAIYNPARDQLYFAEKGKGTILNGNKIKVSNRSLDKAVIMTHLSSKKDSRDILIPHLEEIFSNGMHMRMFGCGFADMTYIAGGNFDVFFEVKTNPWDILPGALLIQEAGGKVTDIKGEKISIKSTSVLATNGVAHKEMLALLKNV